MPTQEIRTFCYERAEQSKGFTPVLYSDGQNVSNGYDVKKGLTRTGVKVLSESDPDTLAELEKLYPLGDTNNEIHN